ncbi:MAG: sulfatase-like hydrolase/transferase [Chitinivibrionales bacterium]|nr:sulfatase-like hydrolase/transferase [Chitinivibrionales bacterium]
MSKAWTRSFNRRQFIADMVAAGCGAFYFSQIASPYASLARSGKRPNILVGMADDWSWPHASTAGAAVNTPTFDRMAREGVLFENAFATAPSCTPSRAAILTGQWHWRLEQGANLWGTLPAEYPVYPDLLEQSGYHVGYCGKGWGPGRVKPGGRTRNPAGRKYRSFDHFLKARPPATPFCFWFGSHDPHRFYGPRTRILNPVDPSAITVPPYLPDTAAVRKDLARYYFEVQRFDSDFGVMLDVLELMGELDNTLVIMTSDNGMPFPRCKSNLYDGGVQVPLVMRWGDRGKRTTRVQGMVSLCDLAPTILDAADVSVPPQCNGSSLLPAVTGSKAAHECCREYVLTGKERHIPAQAEPYAGYPMRALRTDDFLYIRNFRPDRWPAGIPPKYRDVDTSPSKKYLLANRGTPSVNRLFQLAFAKRPPEELYDLRNDPWQMENVVARQPYQAVRQRLADKLREALTASGDPRALGNGDVFDSYAYYMLKNVSQ